MKRNTNSLKLSNIKLITTLAYKTTHKYLIKLIKTFAYG